jgi:uncharacterized protein YjbI with pentapeptide repeats
VVILLALVALFAMPLAVEAQRAGSPVLPGGPCGEPPRQGVWSPTESWVWGEVCTGRVADINRYLGKVADPSRPEEWADKRRRLSPAFIETILLYEPYRGAVPRPGVYILGALLDEPLDLRDAQLRGPFGLARSRIATSVYMGGVRAPAGVSFIGSLVTEMLELSGASVKYLALGDAKLADANLRRLTVADHTEMVNATVTGHLAFDGASIGGTLFGMGAQLANVSLRGARVTDHVDLVNATVTGSLSFDGATIGGTFFSMGAKVADLSLRGVKVTDHVDLSEAAITASLSLDGASVGRVLAMRGAKLADVSLRGVRVNDHVDLGNAAVSGLLSSDDASIGRTLFMSDGVFEKEASLIFTTIKGNLDFRGARLAGVDLTGTRVEGELNLGFGTRLPTWKDGARLILRNTSVNALQDEPQAWPSGIDLDGFTYERLGGFSDKADSAIAARETEWFVRWLRRDEPYSPQPYEQLATVLHRMGHGTEANAVLFASRERARDQAWKEGRYGSWLGLSLLKLTIGYGYGQRYFRSLYWILGLVGLGTIVLRATGQDRQPGGSRIGVWYAFDMLLPIVKLNEQHYKIELRRWVRYYFYFHKLMGYVLGSFIVAGLSGLTK